MLKSSLFDMGIKSVKYIIARNWPMLLVLLFMTIGIGIYLVAMPKTGDDYWFGVFLRPWFEKNGYMSPECGWGVLRSGIPIDDIMYSWYCHYGVDNARLANQIVMFFLMLPKWVGSTLALLCWVLTMKYSLKLSGINIGQTLIIALGIFLWSFQMPWNDNMGQLDYQFNYVIPGGLIMWYIWSVCHYDWKGWKKILLVLTGILIGAWHEGFSLPVAAGGLAVTLFYPEYRKRRIFMAIGALAVGVLYLMLCPGTAVRMGNQVNVVTHSLLLILQCVVSHATYLIVLILTLIIVLRRKNFRIAPIVLFTIICGGLMIVVQIMTNGARRVGWWTDLISIVALMYILNEMRRSAIGIRRYISMGLSGVLCILSLLHWVYVDYYAFIVRDRIRQIEHIMAGTSDKIIFSDFPTAYDLPLICAWTPDMKMFTEPSALAYMNGYYFYSDTKSYRTLIPEGLRCVTSESGHAVPGGTGIREANGHYFVEASRLKDKIDSNQIKGNIRMSTGIGGEELFLVRPFVSEGDGCKYYYIYPSEQIWKVLFGKIESITDLKDK